MTRTEIEIEIEIETGTAIGIGTRIETGIVIVIVTRTEIEIETRNVQEIAKRNHGLRRLHPITMEAEVVVRHWSKQSHLTLL